MKKSILLLALLCLSFSAKTSAQDDSNGWYIQTQQYGKYRPAAQVSADIEHRYDKVGREILTFTYSNDDTIDVVVTDYDKVGNATSIAKLCLYKYDRADYTYILAAIAITTNIYDAADQLISTRNAYSTRHDEFQSLIKKIADRLDNKEE